MTYVDEEEEQVFWFDVSQGLDSEVYIQINDVKYINNTNNGEDS